MRWTWWMLGLVACSGGDGKGGAVDGVGTPNPTTEVPTGDDDDDDDDDTTTAPVDPCPTPSPICDGQGLCTLDVVLTTHVVSGSVSYDGSPLVGDGGDDWVLTFVDTSSGRSFTSLFPGGGTYAAPVYPGTYDVYFELLDGDVVQAPVFGPEQVAAGLVVSADTPLDLNIETRSVSGTVSWDGEPLVTDGGDDFMVLFVDRQTDTWFTHALPGAGQYDVAVFDGTYEVRFELLDADVVRTPVFGQTVVAPSLAISADATLDLALDTVEVSGALSWDGRALQTDGGDDLAVVFTDPSTGDRFVTAQPGAGGWSANVFPGVYDLALELLDTDVTPKPVSGEFEVASAMSLTADTTYDITVSPVRLSGQVLYDGSGMAGDGGDDWSLTLHDPGSDRWSTTWMPGAASYELFVVPGSYDAYFELTDDDVVQQPVHGRVPVGRSLSVTGDTTHDLVLDTALVSGSISWEGQPLRGDGGDDVSIVLHELGSDEWATHALPGGASWQAAVVPGTYDVYVDLLDADVVLTPVFGRIQVAEAVVVGGDTPLDIVVEPVIVEGTVTYDTAALVGDGGDDWILTFDSPYDDDTIYAHALEGAGTYSVGLVPGIYDAGFDLLDGDVVFRPVFGQVQVGSCLLVE